MALKRLAVSLAWHGTLFHVCDQEPARHGLDASLGLLVGPGAATFRYIESTYRKIYRFWVDSTGKGLI